MLSKNVSARINWHEAVDAVVDMVGDGESGDFSEYDAEQMEKVARIIRDKLAEGRSTVRARPHTKTVAPAQLDAIPGS